jgi:CubicO group peptidase (beta-lactamase class C family)
MNNPLKIKKSMAMLLALVLLLSLVAPAMAQGNKVMMGKNVPTMLTKGQGLTDPAELEAFLDELMAEEMEAYHIAGAAVSVVKEGKLFFAKGYGYADIEKGIPVDPEQTIFRFGSVGKTFTWTAVMQLAEQGKLDLDADINDYLDFRIPATYPQPITLKHLLTHTSGLDERWTTSIVSDAKDLVPAREWLTAHMAPRLRPPGEVAAYSNVNAMLAGYIVARVSGQPYDQYIQEHILNPLGMMHSTAQGSIPADLRAYASRGYVYSDGAFQAFPGSSDFILQEALLPSGSIQASVTDMARFMIAHLQNGRYSDENIPEARILKESTAQQMHSTLYTPDPRILGTTYGLFDFSDNGQRTLGYTGYSPPMNSLLLLLPDQNLGVSVIYNSGGSKPLVDQHNGFQRAFFDHYYPATAIDPIQPPADFAQRAGRFAGSYRPTLGTHTTYLKAGGLMGGALEIRDSGDGALLINTPWGEWRLVEVEPLYFRQEGTSFGFVFREDDRGHITHMFSDTTPQTAYKKLDWYETSSFHMALLWVCILIFLPMIPIVSIGLIRGRRPSSDRNPSTRGARTAYWIILAICVLNPLFFAGTYMWIFNITELHPPSLIFQIVLGLGVLSALLTIGALVYTVLAWKNRYWGLSGRAYYTLVTVAAVAYVWFLNYWSLLGWRY